MAEKNEQESALALIEQPQHVIVHTMSDIERAAKAMAASGFFRDSRQVAQAVVKILAGRELGFGPFSSMTGVHIVSGKPVLAANLMAAAVKRTGKYDYRVKRLDDEGCEIEFFEGNISIGTSSFTREDAAQAGLLGKEVWKKYPRNMYFARALSNGQKWYAPDVFNGVTVYTPEELGGSVDADGNYVPPEDSIEDGEYTQPPEDIIVPFKKARSLFDGRAPTLKELYARDSDYVKWIAENVDDSTIQEAAARIVAENAQAPHIDMVKLIQEAPFMQTHDERKNSKPPIVMTQYWQDIKDRLRAAGFETDDSIKKLLKDLDLTTHLEDWVTGFFRLISQFANYINDNPNQVEYAKSVVRQGIAAQQDWFGAVESLEEPLIEKRSQESDVLEEAKKLGGVVVKGKAKKESKPLPDEIPDL